MISDPGYAVVVVVHVILAVVGFAALGATGAYAHAARRTTDPVNSVTLRRYFSPGHNIAARAIFLVPVAGGVLVGLSGDQAKLYPYIGLGIWVAAVGLATAVLWPAERTIQQMLDRGSVRDPEFALACRRCEGAATMTSVLFVAALAVMIARP